MHLGDCVQISSGYPFRGSVLDEPGAEICVIQGKNLSGDHVVPWDKLAKTSVTSRREPDWLRDEDILFTARGASNYAVLLSNVPEYTLCTPQFFVIRVMPDTGLLPAFLAWQLNQLPCQRHYDENRAGKTVGNITRDTLAQSPITIPNMETQHKVAGLVETIQHEKTVLTQLQNNLEQHMRVVAQDVLTFEGNQV